MGLTIKILDPAKTTTKSIVRYLLDLAIGRLWLFRLNNLLDSGNSMSKIVIGNTILHGHMNGKQHLNTTPKTWKL
jgi:hypothetical protein